MNVVAGQDPFELIIEGLDQASSEPAGFDFRVSALNSAGYGRPSASLNIKVRQTMTCKTLVSCFGDSPCLLRHRFSADDACFVCSCTAGATLCVILQFFTVSRLKLQTAEPVASQAAYRTHQKQPFAF